MNPLYLLIRRGDEILLDMSGKLLALPSVTRKTSSDPCDALDRFLRSIAIVRKPGKFERVVDIENFDVFELKGADIYAPGYAWCAFKASDSFDPVVKAIRSLELRISARAA